MIISDDSGSRYFDFESLSAVQAAAPFPPLPEEFADDTLRIHVRFETIP